jgi:nitroreductase
MSFDLLSVITARHCKRAYLDRAVPPALLHEVLAAAAHAPSTRNAQPWEVVVVSGAARTRLVDRLCAAFDADDPVRSDYANRRPTTNPRESERAERAARGLFEARGISRDDADGRRAHQRRNFQFHGAPVAMILHLPADAVPGTFLEMGFFLQNVMLGLVGCGLGSCPQFSPTGYSDCIRAELGLGADRLIVCSLAVGYPDPAAVVNRFAPERATVSEYTRWLD